MQALPLAAVESSPRRPLTAPIRVAVACRLYFDLEDIPQIIDIPLGQIVTPFVERARTAGGTNLRVHALDGTGATLDRVVVRA